MKKLVVLLALLTLVLAACGRPDSGGDKSSNGGEGEDSYTIRISHLVPEEQSSHMALESFKEKLEAESDGRLTVELYPNGQLYELGR